MLTNREHGTNAIPSRTCQPALPVYHLMISGSDSVTVADVNFEAFQYEQFKTKASLTIVQRIL